MSRGPEFFSGQFLTPPRDRNTATQRICRVPQQFALPGSADQACFARAKIVLGESDQSGNQLGNSVPAAGRDIETRRPLLLPLFLLPLSLLLGHWPTGCIEVDLVAHQPDRRPALAIDFG